MNVCTWCETFGQTQLTEAGTLCDKCYVAYQGLQRRRLLHQHTLTATCGDDDLLGYFTNTPCQACITKRAKKEGFA